MYIGKATACRFKFGEHRNGFEDAVRVWEMDYKTEQISEIF
ncbi:hypothetical protein ACQKPE_05150 [Pseudomonas sp. NPDC089554]